MLDFPGSSDGKVSAYNAEDPASIPGSGRSSGEGFSSTLAWKIPWMEEHGRLLSVGSQRVGHDWGMSRAEINRIQSLPGAFDPVRETETWWASYNIKCMLKALIVAKSLKGTPDKSLCSISATIQARSEKAWAMTDPCYRLLATFHPIDGRDPGVGTERSL